MFHACFVFSIELEGYTREPRNALQWVNLSRLWSSVDVVRPGHGAIR